MGAVGPGLCYRSVRYCWGVRYFRNNLYCYFGNAIPRFISAVEVMVIVDGHCCGGATEEVSTTSAINTLTKSLFFFATVDAGVLYKMRDAFLLVTRCRGGVW